MRAHGSNMNLFKMFRLVFVNALILFLFTEFLLRYFPTLIPFSLLVDFQGELRTKIAKKRGLPNKDIIIPVIRDDGGPPHRLWRYKPYTKVQYDWSDTGAVKITSMDKMGFCNPVPDSYDDSKVDIITLGDSFTWCTGVNPEDTWTTKLSLLSSRSAYNLGLPGIGVFEYLQLLKRFGLQKKPKVVIMNIYEGNDLRDVNKVYLYRDKEKNPTKSHIVSNFLKENPVGRHSYSLNLLLACGKGIIVYIESILDTQDHKQASRDFRFDVAFRDKVIRFNNENFDSDEIIYAEKLLAGEIRLEYFSEPLEIFMELSKRHNFIPVVAYTPSAHTAYKEFVRFHDSNLHSLMEFYSNKLRNYFQKRGKDLGYVFIDLTPCLQATAKTNGSNSLIFFPVNLHLTQKGHEVIAEELNYKIQSLGRGYYSQL